MLEIIGWKDFVLYEASSLVATNSQLAGCSWELGTELIKIVLCGLARADSEMGCT